MPPATNLIAILESAGMGIDDVVKVVTYVTSEEDVVFCDEPT